jgi:hypothetical protein
MFEYPAEPLIRHVAFLQAAHARKHIQAGGTIDHFGLLVLFIPPGGANPTVGRLFAGRNLGTCSD